MRSARIVLCLGVLCLGVLACAEVAAQRLQGPGFEVQVLEPLGGEALRPTGWFHRERHGGPQYRWILSREDPDLGPYAVGMSIQVIANLREVAGKDGPALAEEFVAGRRRAGLVMSECPESQQGFFLRRCVQTIEASPTLPYAPMRVQYSVMYRDGLDLFAVVIAGAPMYEWPRYAPVFDAMADIRLIDMTRFD